MHPTFDAMFKMWRGEKQIPVPTRILMEHGKEYRQSLFTPKPGIPKACYYNALTQADDQHVYTEGWGIIPGLGVPINHAWLTATDGVAVDPTWHGQTDCIYYGVQFRREFVQAMYERTKLYSVFDSLYALRMSLDDIYEYLKRGIVHG